MLIDTGSSRSFINPEICSKYFNNLIKNDPFIVSSVFQKSAHKYSVNIPISKIFQSPKLKQLKFFLFKFHDTFDGLIGLDNLEKLEASINFKTGYLTTPFAEIKLLFYNVKNNFNYINISPRTEQVIELKTSILDGEIIIPYQKLHNCEIPECLSVARNGKAITTILNNTTSPVSLDLSAPILVEKFNKNDLKEINLNNLENFSNSKFQIENLIRTNHMNIEEKNKITKLCKEFSDIFYNENTALSFTNKIKHQIKTTDETPIYTKSYRYPYIHKKEVESQINKMLDQNIIRPSNSPWSSPIWVVPKKMDASGKQKWRVVVDYRKLNEKTIDDKYPLPNITDLLDKLGRCQYFSTLDLASGFHQIQMNEEDIQKTAFSCENGHYEYLRMPFGLKNAPSTFQRVMDNILRGIHNEKCAVYLDDVIIYSTSLDEHIQKLREIFQRFRDSNFKIQLDKSEFLKKEVAYLGHVVTPEGVKPNPDKIKAIKQYPIPNTTKQIKGFLGLLGYYRRFINNFAKLTKPLTKCLKKNAKIEHNDEFKSCFETCKNILINEPILQYPNFSRPFNLTTDASNVALGAVLSQGPIGKDLPVAYASRTLNESEQNYSTIEKELLCIVWATKYFRPYLFGRKFNIITDHKPLQWLFSLKDPNSKLLRWRIKLEEFDYKILYKKGTLNTNADALSRIEINTKETNTGFDLFKYMDDFNRNLEQTTSNNGNDNLSTQAQPDQDNHNNKEVQTVHSNAEQNPIVGIPIVDMPVNYGAYQILISSVFHSPSKPKLTILFQKKKRFTIQISQNNFENDILSFIKEYIVPDTLYYLYFENSEIYEPFCEVIRKNFKWPSLIFKRCKFKLLDVTDENEIPEIIKNYHESKTNHRGIDETEQRIKKVFYWPNLKRSIQTYINECNICQQTKYERHPVKMEMNITPTAVKPFEIIHADTFTLEKQKFLTIIDSFSKYAQAYPINSLNSTEIVDKLLIYFSHHDVPENIIIDNGTEFKNSVITQLFDLHKVKTHFISPNHPQSNGVIERLHSTLIEHVRILNTKGFLNTPISQKIVYAILAYNHSIHSTTKLKPIDIIKGHITNENPFNVNIEETLLNDYINDHKQKTKILYAKINENLMREKESRIKKINENRDSPDLFAPQQQVHIKKHIRQKTANKFLTPCKIKETNPHNKTISTETKQKVHMDNLKRPLKKTYKFSKK